MAILPYLHDYGVYKPFWCSYLTQKIDLFLCSYLTPLWCFYLSCFPGLYEPKRYNPLDGDDHWSKRSSWTSHPNFFQKLTNEICIVQDPPIFWGLKWIVSVCVWELRFSFRSLRHAAKVIVLTRDWTMSHCQVLFEVWPLEDTSTGA